MASDTALNAGCIPAKNPPAQLLSLPVDPPLILVLMLYKGLWLPRENLQTGRRLFPKGATRSQHSKEWKPQSSFTNRPCSRGIGEKPAAPSCCTCRQTHHVCPEDQQAGNGPWCHIGSTAASDDEGKDQNCCEKHLNFRSRFTHLGRWGLSSPDSQGETLNLSLRVEWSRSLHGLRPQFRGRVSYRAFRLEFLTARHASVTGGLLSWSWFCFLSRDGT